MASTIPSALAEVDRGSPRYAMRRFGETTARTDEIVC